MSRIKVVFATRAARGRKPMEVSAGRRVCGDDGGSAHVRVCIALNESMATCPLGGVGE